MRTTGLAILVLSMTPTLAFAGPPPFPLCCACLVSTGPPAPGPAFFCDEILSTEQAVNDRGPVPAFATGRRAFGRRRRRRLQNQFGRRDRLYQPVAPACCSVRACCRPKAGLAGLGSGPSEPRRRAPPAESVRHRRPVRRPHSGFRHCEGRLISARPVFPDPARFHSLRVAARDAARPTLPTHGDPWRVAQRRATRCCWSPPAHAAGLRRGRARDIGEDDGDGLGARH
jgi:hypothetical protein